MKDLSNVGDDLDSLNIKSFKQSSAIVKHSIVSYHNVLKIMHYNPMVYLLCTMCSLVSTATSFVERCELNSTCVSDYDFGQLSIKAIVTFGKLL